MVKIERTDLMSTEENSIKIVMLTVEEILKNYSEIAPQLDKALVHSSGEWSTTEVIQGAISDPVNMHIWDIYDDGLKVATASTRLIKYNSFTSLHIITLGGRTNGKFKIWTENFVEMVKVYPQIDCVEFTGKRGLVRPLEACGWKERYTTMRISLKEGFEV